MTSFSQRYGHISSLHRFTPCSVLATAYIHTKRTFFLTAAIFVHVATKGGRFPLSSPASSQYNITASMQNRWWDSRGRQNYCHQDDGVYARSTVDLVPLKTYTSVCNRPFSTLTGYSVRQRLTNLGGFRNFPYLKMAVVVTNCA